MKKKQFAIIGYDSMEEYNTSIILEFLKKDCDEYGITTRFQRMFRILGIKNIVLNKDGKIKQLEG